MSAPRYAVRQLDDIAPVACPCGQARRAFGDDPADVASVHLTDISVDAETHYHKAMTEIYVILEGEGHMELDGDLVPVKPLTAVVIRPGCRHRAVGEMRILNIPVPPFNDADEWFDA
ncbi:MAG: cupin domain-containing protein [Rhodobacterales bacterium]|nr:cupin domain-containing protein [Rhodobacterales bacterium]